MHWATWALQQGVLQPQQLRAGEGDVTHVIHVLRRFLTMVPPAGGGAGAFLGCEGDVRHLAENAVLLLRQVWRLLCSRCSICDGHLAATPLRSRVSNYVCVILYICRSGVCSVRSLRSLSKFLDGCAMAWLHR